ncbi:MAG: Gfo/Idh/MocA family oxidoreductase, partial [Deltaproteobacteria bacterium]
RSVKLEKEITEEQKIVIGRFELNASDYIGIGRQPWKDRYKKFHPRLIFKVRSGLDIELSKLRFEGDTLLKISSYLPNEECPLDDSLPGKITSLNPDLKIVGLEIPNDLLWETEKVINENRKRFFLYGYGSYVRAYSEKFFKHNINAIVDYNKKVWTSFNRKNRVSYFEDYRDSLPSYAETERPVAIVATYHSSHFKIAKELFQANPRGKVFIEKPLVVKFSDALALIKLRKEGFWFEVGYNRRYIDWNKMIKQVLENTRSPKVINISIKELLIPPTHWYYWPNQGTRITGNLCHWIDLAYFWLRCRPREMSLMSTGDSVSLSILFEDDSLVNIVASDRGNNLRGVQEKIEIRTGDKTIFIDDYKRMIFYDNGKSSVKRRLLRGKGHDQMYKEFLRAIKTDGEPLYENEDIFWVSYLTEEASKMFVNKQKYIKINMAYDKGHVTSY